MQSPHALIRVYLHFNWSTKYRTPSIDAQAEEIIQKVVLKKSVDLGFHVLALNGTDDHVHLLVGISSTVTLSEIMKHVKGTSAFVINKVRKARGEHAPKFRWQSGFAVFSIAPGAVDSVMKYVENQKLHHQRGTIKPDLEVQGEDGPDDGSVDPGC